ncbi:hypothetical protein JCM11641_001233 [Rhodosporidiobolus odoratus]
MNSLVTVVQLAVPPVLATFEEYEERTKTLHNFAATSKRLHPLAVQELRDVVRVQKKGTRLAGPVLTPETGVRASVLVLETAATLLDDDAPFRKLEADEISSLLLLTPGRTAQSVYASPEMLPQTLILPPPVRVLRIESIAMSYFLPPFPYTASVPNLALQPYANQHFSPEDHDFSYYADAALGAFQELSDSIRAAVLSRNLPLKLVLLDKAFSSPSVPPVLQAAQAAFVEYCAGAGIEVLQVEKPEYDHESIVSKQFIRWCEEKYA